MKNDDQLHLWGTDEYRLKPEATVPPTLGWCDMVRQQHQPLHKAESHYVNGTSLEMPSNGVRGAK